MKKHIVFLLLIFFFCSDVQGQRYLNPVFTSTSQTTNILYGAAQNYLGANQNLLLDFYEPSGDTATLRPLLIYIHGGGFVDTNQSKSLVHIKAFGDSLARRGYTVASINYRLDTSISNRAVINAMHDAKAAVRFFRANAPQYKINPDFIFIGGESAGAITSLTTTYINNMAEVSYPNTLPTANNNTVEGNSGNPNFSSETKAVLCLCGGTKTILNELLFDTSAIIAGDQPILFVHGTNDQLIHVAQSIEIVQRVTNLGIPNLFYTMNGAGHCPWFFPLPNSTAYLDTLIDYTVPFLYACIQGSTGTTNYSTIKKLNIYPNPSNNIFTIQSNIAQRQGTLYIFNQSGLIRSQSIELNNGRYTFDLSEYATGVYYIKLRLSNYDYIGTVLKN